MIPETRDTGKAKDRALLRSFHDTRRRRIATYLIFGIMVLVFVFFAPILKNGFVWDDEFNLINNYNYRGLSWTHLAWMFTTIHDANYHPLCWLSLGVDYSLWGMNPAGYHLTDLVLHSLNAVLLFLFIAAVLRHRSVDAAGEAKVIQIGAALGALFFALHPLRVESVAWVSTRGDTLCGFFYLLTLLCYLRIGKRNTLLFKNRWLWLSLFFYTCSLLSRAWGITLPVVLFILDFYPLQRVRLQDLSTGGGRRIVYEKIPFALLAFACAILALMAKRGSMVPVADHGFLERLMQSFYGLCFYPWKTLLPVDLSPLYLLHNLEASDSKYALCALAVTGVTVLLIVFRKRWPWALCAWVCYGIIISPQLGLVQSGPQVVADRYSYFAGLPFAVLVGAGFFKVGGLYRDRRISRKLLVVFLSGAAALLLLLGMASHRHSGIWRNNLSFWDQIIRLDPLNYVAVNERARLKFDDYGDLAGAEADFSRALELKPDYVEATVNRGLVRLQLKRYKDAARDFNTVKRMDAGFADAYNGLGLVAYEQGWKEEAREHFNRAIQLNPDFADVYNNRGLLYRNENRLSAALADFDAALRLNPDFAAAYVNRGVVHQLQQHYNRAAFDFESALKSAPANWPHRRKVARQLRQVYALREAAGQP